MKTCDGIYGSCKSVQFRPNTSITLSVVVWAGRNSDIIFIFFIPLNPPLN